MKKSFTLIAVFLIASLLLGACAQATEAPTEVPTEAPTEAPTEEPTEAPTEEVVEPAGKLVVWADDTRAPILDTLKEPRFKYQVQQ